MSGGTAASLINAVKELSGDPALRKKAVNHYLLCPNNYPNKSRQQTAAYYYSANLKSWCAPFIMASINTRVVHRSNALLSCQYGEDFKYSEYTMVSGRLRAIGMASGMGGFMGLLSMTPTRRALENCSYPNPAKAHRNLNKKMGSSLIPGG